MEILHFITKWNAEIMAIATAIIAIGTVVLTFGLLIAKREEKYKFYATLDDTYFNLKKLVIDFPDLSQTTPEGKSAEQLVRYDAFAFMTWNFIESIVDYSEGDKFLRDTWECILRHEAATHRAWFDVARNRDRFKQRFCEYMQDHHFVTRMSHPESSAVRTRIRKRRK
jgi:hypothetical protein